MSSSTHVGRGLKVAQVWICCYARVYCRRLSGEQRSPAETVLGVVVRDRACVVHAWLALWLKMLMRAYTLHTKYTTY